MIFAVVVATVISTLIGVVCERRFGKSAQRASHGVLTSMVWVFVPFVAFFTIGSQHLSLDSATGIVLAYLTTVVVGLLAWQIGKRLLHLEGAQLGTLIVASILANTGYLGLPMVSVLLGTDHLGEASAFDVLVSAPALLIGAFAVGAAFGTKAGSSRKDRFKAFLYRNPPLLAVAAALVVPDSFTPQLLIHAAHIVAFSLLPLGFFTVGVTLAAEAEDGVVSFPPKFERPVAVAMMLRLVFAPVLLALLAWPLIDLPTTYLLLIAMPSGVNTLVVAHTYGLDLKLAAETVAWTTTVAIALSPVLALLL